MSDIFELSCEGCSCCTGGGVSRFNLLHLSGALSRRWPDFTILHLIAVFSGPFTTSQEANCNIFEHGGRGGGWRLLLPRVQVRTRAVVKGRLEAKEEAGFIVVPKPVSHFAVCCQITVNSILLSLPSFFHAGYLEQVDLEEEKDGQEASAMEEFHSGDANAQTVPHLLEKLSAPGRVPSYYRGGLEILTQALAGCECPRGRRSRHFFLSPVISLRSSRHFTGSPISQLCG